jgi:ParB family chromosome partitioning protein
MRPSIAAEVEISLSEALGTEVKVDYQQGRGSLRVGFYSDAQLRDFANLLGGYSQEKP